MAQRLVWSFFVVLLKPQFGLFADFIQSLKTQTYRVPLHVAAIESFNVTILHRPSWLDELEHHVVLFGPIFVVSDYDRNDSIWRVPVAEVP